MYDIALVANNNNNKGNITWYADCSHGAWRFNCRQVKTMAANSVSGNVSEMEGGNANISNRDKLKLNVGGTEFLTFQSSILAYPDTRLAALSKDSPEYDSEIDTFFFDRNPHLFNFILDLYRKGELHFPDTLCHKAAKEELDFWGIGCEYISECCKERLLEDLRTSQREERLEKCFTGNEMKDREAARKSNTEGTLRNRLYMAMEYPRTSRAAKVT